MSAAKALIQGFVAKLLPGGFTDDRDDAKPARMKRYGEVSLSEFDGNMYGYNEEGSLLVATTPTISTGLAWVAAQQTFVDTSPNLYIYNPENPASPGAKSLYLGWFKMLATAVSTAATTWHYAGILDNRDRPLTTDNMLAIVPVSPNGNVSSPGLMPIIKAQNSATVSAITASSASKRLVCRGGLGGITVIGDELIINWGRGNMLAHAGLTAVAAVPGKRVSNSPPVIIGPGQSFTLHLWGLASTATFTPEVELVMWAR